MRSFRGTLSADDISTAFKEDAHQRFGPNDSPAVSPTSGQSFSCVLVHTCAAPAGVPAGRRESLLLAE